MSKENLDPPKVLRPEPIRSESHNSYSRSSNPAALEAYEYNGAGKEEKVDLRKLWFTVCKRKWLIIAVVLIITTAVAVPVYKARPLYEAEVMIEIRKDPKAPRYENIPDENDDLSDPLYMVNIKTKMLGLKSNNMHEDVISDLGLDKYPKFLDVAKDNSAFSSLKSLMRTITGQGSAYAKDDDLPPAVVKKAVSAPDGGEELPLNERMRLAPYVKVLEDNLYMEPLRDTQAIRVSFTHTDPMVAAAVVNSIADKFVQRSFRSRTKKFANTAGWLERSTAELKKKTEESEQALADYCREHNILAISQPDKESLTSIKVMSIHDAATRAQTDRMLKGTLYEAVKSGGVAQLPDAFSDPEMNSLQKQLHDLQTLAAQLSVKYAPKNPRLIEVQQQIAVLEKQINDSRTGLEEKLKSDYDRAVQNERSLNETLALIKAEAVKENQANIRYSILKQDVDTARALYTDFLQKTSQAKLRVAEQEKNIRIIEPAQAPLQPVGPTPLLMMLVAFTTSLGASIGLVFFLEYFDDTINSIEDVNRYVQLPALGIIPTATGSPRRLFSARRRATQRVIVASGSTGESHAGLHDHRNAHSLVLGDRSPVAEAYRVLRTSVLLSSGGIPPRTILITSSQPGEGKTTTVVNTAISMAQVGASVLVIDCDLRTPTVHKMLGVSNEPGLSTYLSSEVEIDSLIQKLRIPNLSLLPAGPPPPNPAELISAKKMREMLSALAGRYDHILIDSPPLINLADPLQLSTLVDGVILVVHGGKSTRDMVLRAREDLLAVGADIYGVVLNNADMRRSGINPQNYYKYLTADDNQD